MTTENAASIRKHAAELTAFAPDAILAFGASTVGPLLQETRTVHTVPIVLSRATSSQICFQLPLPFVDYSNSTVLNSAGRMISSTSQSSE